MNRLMICNGFFFLVSASVVTVMATATRVAAGPIALTDTRTLDELIALSYKERSKIDIAALNLASAEGLPGSRHIDRWSLPAKLDVWAGFVAYETQRHRFRFEKHPEEYNHSWGEFAMLMTAATLQQDLGVRYTPDQITPEDDPSGFDFTRSQDLLIHGPLDGTGRGYDTYSDESGRHWTREWNDAQRDSGNYLKSLTSREELAVFLKTRGDHLFLTGRLFDPLRCYETTIQLSPRICSANDQYEQTARLIEKLEAQSRTEHVASEVEAAYRRQERRRRTDPRLIMTGTPKFPTEHPASRRQLGLAAHGHGVLFPISGLQSLRSASPLGSFDRTGSIMPSFQESLEAPILCNEALIRFVKPNIHRLNRGVVPVAPRRRIRNHRARR